MVAVEAEYCVKEAHASASASSVGGGKKRKRASLHRYKGVLSFEGGRKEGGKWFLWTGDEELQGKIGNITLDASEIADIKTGTNKKTKELALLIKTYAGKQLQFKLAGQGGKGKEHKGALDAFKKEWKVLSKEEKERVRPTGAGHVEALTMNGTVPVMEGKEEIQGPLKLYAIRFKK